MNPPHSTRKHRLDPIPTSDLPASRAEHAVLLPLPKRLRLAVYSAVAASCLAALSACGGGGSGADTPAAASPAAASPTGVEAGVAVDGSSGSAGDPGSGVAPVADSAQAEVGAAAPDNLGAGSADAAASLTPAASDPSADPAVVMAAAVSGGAASVPGAITVPYPTLQNLTVEWAFAGDTNANAAVAVRFRKAGTTAWSTGMPLRRVAGGSNKGYTWATRHSGSIFDVNPGTTYDIELSLKDPDGGGATKIVQATTRSVPVPMANAPVKPVTPATFRSVMAGAVAGDILELAAGTYSAPTVDKNGSAGKPIVLRRAASAPAGSVIINGELYLTGRQYVHVQGLTINGRIRFNATTGVAIIGNTVNASASVGGGDGIVTYLPSYNAYIADNTVIGTTVWANSSLGVNGGNLGEGILVTGPGHVVMNNRVRGFRDNISFLEGEQALTQFSIDVLNNELSEAADDAIEADYCHHNCRIMRNRITNAFIGMSSQPSLGGPTYFIRNAAYNIAHVGFKLYNGSVGDVLLHNTVVKNGDGFGAYPGAPITNLLARNNLFIGGAGGTYGGYSSGTGSPLSLYDLNVATASLNYNAYGSTNNAFNGRFGPTIRYANVTELRSLTTEKNAVAVDLSVFASAVGFPSAPMTQYAAQDLRLKASAAVDVGLAIPNINDGFAGTAPDAGAYEAGVALPLYGPR